MPMALRTDEAFLALGSRDLRRRSRCLSVPIALSILVVAASCSRPAPTASDVVRPVRTMVVAAGEDSHVRTFPGRVEASNKVELAFQVPGLLVSLPIREGQNIAKNDVIAQLRQDEFQARLKALQGQLDAARADLQALRAGASRMILVVVPYLYSGAFFAGIVNSIDAELSAEGYTMIVGSLPRRS